jgi:hypothetical protein
MLIVYLIKIVFDLYEWTTRKVFQGSIGIQTREILKSRRIEVKFLSYVIYYFYIFYYSTN